MFYLGGFNDSNKTKAIDSNADDFGFRFCKFIYNSNIYSATFIYKVSK